MTSKKPVKRKTAEKYTIAEIEKICKYDLYLDFARDLLTSVFLFMGYTMSKEASIRGFFLIIAFVALAIVCFVVLDQLKKSIRNEQIFYIKKRRK